MRSVEESHGAHSLCMHRRKPAVLFSMLSYRSMSWVLRFGFCVLPSALVLCQDFGQYFLKNPDVYAMF